MNKTGLQFLLMMLIASTSAVAQRTVIPLNGTWNFALDPLDVGVSRQWTAADFPRNRWDTVRVPHCFSVDARYQLYTGSAWYFRSFKADKAPEGFRAFLHFEAVFYQAEVWLNGKQVGVHEGGYTPFEIEVTGQLKSDNAIAVKVNNSWDTTTIPGAKTPMDTDDDNVGQVYPWINYGGINREAYLIVRPSTFVQKVKIETDPDIAKKTALLKIQVDITGTQQIANISPTIMLYRGGKVVPVKFRSTAGASQVNGMSRHQFEGKLTAKDVALWSHDDPNLYQAQVIFKNDTLRSTFGIRKIEVKGTSLLLNGEPVRMGGCNRPLDYPGWGSMDPQAVLDKDLSLIKSGGMELSRISHYPVSTALLDWADQHGLLIIAEPGNWQMTPAQMSDPKMRSKFQQQFREMMERDWNHPSVIAWSVGNEYQSQTPEGKSWTKDMIDYGRSMDASRLYTFASMIVWRDYIRTAADEASQYVDFISANIYGNHLKHLQHIHELYPDKPVYLSEFGVRTDGVKNERERVDHLIKAMNDFRQCDFLIGASIWTFNDYQSRFPGTNANGYRPWGLVSPGREIRDMYLKWQDEFSPATMETIRDGTGKTTLTVIARNDFPRYILRNYKVEAGGQSFDIKELRPGERKSFTCDASVTEVRLVKPGGFVVLKKNIQR